jgi:hypothetical protein
MTQSLRDLIFHTRGTKDGLMSAKIYLQTLPLCEVISKIQEHIDGSEDTEIRLSVELEKTSNNPAPVSSCL